MSDYDALKMLEDEMQFLRDRLAQLGQIRNRIKREMADNSCQAALSGDVGIANTSRVDNAARQGV